MLDQLLLYGNLSTIIYVIVICFLTFFITTQAVPKMRKYDKLVDKNMETINKVEKQLNEIEKSVKNIEDKIKEINIRCEVYKK